MTGSRPPGKLAVADLGDEARWSKDWTRDFALFAGLDEALRHAVEAEVEWLGLPGGRVLFEAGEPADAMFLVLSGALGVVGAASEDRQQLVAHIHAGETIGEMSLLTDRPVSVTIVALRDCILARLDRSAFERVVAREPILLRALGAQVVGRFEQSIRRVRPGLSRRTLAVIPVHAGPDATAEFATALCTVLAARGRRIHRLSAATAVSQDADAFHAVEAAHDLTIYEGDGSGGAWDALCARRGDRVLLVAEGRASPPERRRDAPPWRPHELVLLQHGAATSPPPAEAWLLRLDVETHHHVRRGNAADLARLARHLTGEAVGVVFSGGGARGYGHIGVVKALREVGVPMDLVGGTSFGAIVAAGVAAEWDDAELRARFYDAFARSNPLRDYAWPAVALTKGREVTRRLRQHFGERGLEDLWRPCFAVACNLTRGTPVVQRRGPVWAALRASVAIPGLLPPWVVGGEMLVDGGLMNNLPVDVMARATPGPVVAVDVSDMGRAQPHTERPRGWLRRALVGREFEGARMASVLVRAAMVGGVTQGQLGRDQAQLVLEPPLPDVQLLDWKASDRAVEAGYRYTLGRIEELRALGSIAGQSSASLSSEGVLPSFEAVAQHR